MFDKKYDKNYSLQDLYEESKKYLHSPEESFRDTCLPYLKFEVLEPTDELNEET